MNVDTDTQWAYWEGIKNFYQVKYEYTSSTKFPFGVWLA